MKAELTYRTQPEMPEELRGHVQKQRPSVFLGADQAAFEQLVDVCVRFVAAHAHDVGLRHRVVVRDDGQRAQDGARDVLLRREVSDPIDVRGLDAQGGASVCDVKLNPSRGVAVRGGKVGEKVVYVRLCNVTKDRGERAP